MDEKDRVLTLASAARRAGVDPGSLRSMIDEGKLDAVETEGGNLLISENSLKLIIKETQVIEADSNNQSILDEDIKQLLSQAAFFIERQESELKTYKGREEKHISLLEGAEIHITKALDQLNDLHKQNSLLSNENRNLLRTLLKLKIKKN
jgi:predicted site-specific integrase-resolvase